MLARLVVNCSSIVGSAGKGKLLFNPLEPIARLGRDGRPYRHFRSVCCNGFYEDRNPIPWTSLVLLSPFPSVTRNASIGIAINLHSATSFRRLRPCPPLLSTIGPPLDNGLSRTASVSDFRFVVSMNCIGILLPISKSSWYSIIIRLRHFPFCFLY